MKRRLDSLHGRLIAAMLVVFSLGLAVEPQLDRHLAALGRFGPNLLREPYQDLLVIVPLSLGAIALIWLVSAWSLRHVASASREAAQIGPGNLSARISTRRLPEEIRPLVDAVNGVLDRVADAYATERRFVADAAHGLRTPLAVLTLRLQRAKLDGVLDWPTVERDLEQVNRLVGQLLELARQEHAAASAVGEANLSRIAREAAAAIIPLAEQQGRAVEVTLPAALPVRGRADDLRMLIGALLENALLHGRGTIGLAGSTLGRTEHRQVVITVSDEGEGVEAGLREELFKRFRKGNAGSPGHGLGLAIAREVARSHGGSVGFLDGRGCRVRLALPALIAPGADEARQPGVRLSRQVKDARMTDT